MKDKKKKLDTKKMAKEFLKRFHNKHGYESAERFIEYTRK